MFETSIQNDAMFMGSQGSMMPRMSKEEIRARLQSPAGQILLFRYFDFDVRPGYAYRYRVKLVVRNPSFEKPPEQVAFPEVAEGPTRETTWSKESNVAVVPESADYFLKTIDRDPVNEPKPPAGNKPIANFSFFAWDDTKGTMIADNVEIKSYGQFVGGSRKSLHLDVAKPYFKDETVNFRSDDLFLDAEGDIKLDLQEHKDLKMPPQQKVPGHLGIDPVAVVVDRSGDVVALDPSTNAARETELKDRVKRERAPFESYKNKEDKPAGGADGMGMFGGGSADMAGMYGMPGMPNDPKAKKKKTSLKPKS
jgi:hypothetical protein